MPRAAACCLCLLALGAVNGANEYSDISELFALDADAEPAAAPALNASFDLERLDPRQFSRRLRALADAGDGARRQVPHHSAGYAVLHPGWRAEAGRHTVKVKAMDSALQLIYMARHKMRELERENLFNPKDTSYRVAYLYRRLRKLRKRMYDIYTTMKVFHYWRSPTWPITVWWQVFTGGQKREWYQHPGPFLKWHHAAVRLHVDFEYLWWVLVRMHERYCQRMHLVMTRPPGPATAELPSVSLHKPPARHEW